MSAELAGWLAIGWLAGCSAAEGFLILVSCPVLARLAARLLVDLTSFTLLPALTRATNHVAAALARGGYYGYYGTRTRTRSNTRFEY